MDDHSLPWRSQAISSYRLCTYPGPVILHEYLTIPSARLSQNVDGYGRFLVSVRMYPAMKWMGLCRRQASPSCRCACCSLGWSPSDGPRSNIRSRAKLRLFTFLTQHQIIPSNWGYTWNWTCPRGWRWGVDRWGRGQRGEWDQKTEGCKCGTQLALFGYCSPGL